MPGVVADCSLIFVIMPNDSKLIKCFNCGQTHRLDDYGQNTGIICTGCGKKMEPLIFDKNAVTQEDKASVRNAINFLKNFELEVSKSDLPVPEREMWLKGIRELSRNPMLLKAVSVALKSTIDRKPS